MHLFFIWYFLSLQCSSADPSRFRLTKESSFIKGHATNFTGLPVFFYIVSSIMLFTQMMHLRGGITNLTRLTHKPFFINYNPFRSLSTRFHFDPFEIKYDPDHPLMHLDFSVHVRQINNSRTQISNVLFQICFFRQFFSSVGRSDYLTMRHGFISVSSTKDLSFIYWYILLMQDRSTQ